MLSSAPIGCSAHSRKEIQGGKYIFQYFLSQFYRRLIIIILYIKCGNQEVAINMRGTETAFKCTIAFYFHFRYSRSHTFCLYYGAAVLTTRFTRSDACQWCSGSVNYSLSSSVIYPYQRWEVTNYIYSRYCNWVAILLLFKVVFKMCNFTFTQVYFVWSIVLHDILKLWVSM